LVAKQKKADEKENGTDHERQLEEAGEGREKKKKKRVSGGKIIFQTKRSALLIRKGVGGTKKKSKREGT